MRHEKQFHPALLEPLTEKQRNYVLQRMQGQAPKNASVRAGYDGSYYQELEKHEHVRAALDAHYADMRAEHDIQIEDVILGIKAGIEICTEQADGVGVINGWEKLSKICGIAAPERKQVTLSVEGQAVHNQLQQLEEDQLLQLLGKERQLIIDAEFEEVNDEQVG